MDSHPVPRRNHSTMAGPTDTLLVYGAGPPCALLTQRRRDSSMAAKHDQNWSEAFHHLRHHPRIAFMSRSCVRSKQFTCAGKPQCSDDRMAAASASNSLSPQGGGSARGHSHRSDREGLSSVVTEDCNFEHHPPWSHAGPRADCRISMSAARKISFSHHHL